MTPGGLTMTDPLAELRGYHPPDPVSWWPPAPGWWLLALLILGLLTWVTVWAVGAWRRRRLARAAPRAALDELAALRAALARNGDAAAFARGLSRLLRRFALARYPRRAVAGLSGEEWLAFLDAHGGGGRFQAGPGRELLTMPYRPAKGPARGEVASSGAVSGGAASSEAVSGELTGTESASAKLTVTKSTSGEAAVNQSTSGEAAVTESVGGAMMACESASLELAALVEEWILLHRHPAAAPAPRGQRP